MTNSYVVVNYLLSYAENVVFLLIDERKTGLGNLVDAIGRKHERA